MSPPMRVLFDTNTVVSALLFNSPRWRWLRTHWASGLVLPLGSADTVAELLRVLAYPKFKLKPDDREELLGDYLPFVQVQPKPPRARLQCRDAQDQMFLDLAFAAEAKAIVSGDSDLLVLAGRTPFALQTPAQYQATWDPEPG